MRGNTKEQQALLGTTLPRFCQRSGFGQHHLDYLGLCSPLVLTECLGTQETTAEHGPHGDKSTPRCISEEMPIYQDSYRPGLDCLLVMYGPPPFCKRKMGVACWSAHMYAAFVGELSPGLDGMPGSTVVPSHGSPANLAGFKKLSSVSRRRWSADVGIAQRFPSLCL